MQRVLIAALLAVIFCCGPSLALAGFEAREIADGYYVVSYELSTWTRGGVLDTQGRVDYKLLKKTHKFCLEKKYIYLRFPLLEEVARNEALRTAWLEVSREMADESGWEKWVESVYNSETHSARKIVFFTTTPGDGLENCKKKLK